jgi:tripartite-type tricarboxylate transporter receptor subunit TctC
MKKCGMSLTIDNTCGRRPLASALWPRSIVMLLIIMLLNIFIFGYTESLAGEASYASKPITIIVPVVPGSAVDFVPRVMSSYLSKKLGVPVNILSKPGGMSVPGTLEAVTAPPDGHTILADCPGWSSIHIAWVKDLPYKVEERTFLARAVAFPTAFNVRADSSWRNLQDVEQAIRKDPASFRWGAVGTTQSDFGIYLLKAALKKKGVDLSKTKTVSFTSSAPATTALAGGHIDIYFGSRSLTQPYVDAGKVRTIAVARSERTNVYPGLPTTVEQGFPSVLTDFWVGFSGPKGLSPNVVQTWERVVKEIVNDPAVLPEWEKLGGTPSYLGSEQFRKFVLDESKEIIAVSNP